MTDYIAITTELPPYFFFPWFLLDMGLTLTAKLTYALLLDRARLSQLNGWTDEAGRGALCPAGAHRSGQQYGTAAYPSGIEGRGNRAANRYLSPCSQSWCRPPWYRAVQTAAAGH